MSILPPGDRAKIWQSRGVECQSPSSPRKIAVSGLLVLLMLSTIAVLAFTADTSRTVLAYGTDLNLQVSQDGPEPEQRRRAGIGRLILQPFIWLQNNVAGFWWWVLGGTSGGVSILATLFYSWSYIADRARKSTRLDGQVVHLLVTSTGARHDLDPAMQQGDVRHYARCMSQAFQSHWLSGYGDDCTENRALDITPNRREVTCVACGVREGGRGMATNAGGVFWQVVGIATVVGLGCLALFAIQKAIAA